MVSRNMWMLLGCVVVGSCVVWVLIVYGHHTDSGLDTPAVTPPEAQLEDVVAETTTSKPTLTTVAPVLLTKPSADDEAKVARTRPPGLRTTASLRAVLHIVDHGTITFELHSRDAPKTVANFVWMARDKGVYNQSCFYRYERGFVLQGGLNCKKPPPHARHSRNVPLEYKRPNEKNTVALARAGGDLNSGGSEFFINLANNTRGLGQKKKGGYAVFASVIDGFATIAKLKTLKVKKSGLTYFVSPQPTISHIEILNQQE